MSREKRRQEALEEEAKSMALIRQMYPDAFAAASSSGNVAAATAAAAAAAVPDVPRSTAAGDAYASASRTSSQSEVIDLEDTRADAAGDADDDGTRIASNADDSDDDTVGAPSPSLEHWMGNSRFASLASPTFAAPAASAAAAANTQARRAGATKSAHASPGSAYASPQATTSAARPMPMVSTPCGSSQPASVALSSLAGPDPLYFPLSSIVIFFFAPKQSMAASNRLPNGFFDGLKKRSVSKVDKSASPAQGTSSSDASHASDPAGKRR